MPLKPLAQGLWIWSVLGCHTSTNGAPLTPTTKPKTMETLTITNNGNTIALNGSYAEIAKFLIGLNEAMGQSAPVVDKKPEVTAKKFINFFSDELSKHMIGGKLFVAKLNQIRLENGNYQQLSGLYYDLVNKGTDGWAQRRQMLLTASAIWRYTFDNFNNKNADLKSQIEAAVECHDCGAFAKQMVERMQSEGLWK